jgi:aminobenzoyl-glutamate transport protein
MGINRMSENTPQNLPRAKGILGLIERGGNALPDPVVIFLWLIVFLVVGSVIAALVQYGVTLPPEVLAAMSPEQIARFGITEDGLISAVSLLSPNNLQRLFVEMPTTFTHFHPLGYVLVVMLGAGVAERTGLFGTAMKAAVSGMPRFLLTPGVAAIAMIGNHAADAAYVVLIPLAGVLYAAVGRHPIAGIAAAFAGVSGGFSANIAPGQLDALLFGITETSAVVLQPDWQVNIAGNTFFIQALLLVYLPIIWFVTDVLIEPRLGKWTGSAVAGSEADEDDPNAPLTDGQKKGMRDAGWMVLAVAALWAFLTAGGMIPLVGDWVFGGDSPLLNESESEVSAMLSPFFQSLVAGFFILFLLAGIAYGRQAGSIKGHRDVVKMMSGAMGDLAYYLVLAFAAAHFVAMFNWSNLGLIFAAQGAEAIQQSGLPTSALLAALVLISGFVNLFVGSASAKWALLAPVLVPMFMMLGVSPEATTAAYRVGDSATNIVTPLMVYFPLVLVFCRRWIPDFGLGSLMSIMVPYGIWLLIWGIALVFAWVHFGFDFGPGAPLEYALPGAN